MAGIGVGGQGRGNLATLVEGPVEYDTVGGRVLNSTRANQLLPREYRKGWSIT